jgi:UDP-N-acetylmuramoylalanine--D-glutamate ligase
VVIMGGRFKSGDFSLLREPLRLRDATVVAIGEATPLIVRAFDGVVPVEQAQTLEAAVRRAYVLARAGGLEGAQSGTAPQPEKVVLLAPACSSFDMFRDYAERGQVFKREVQTLAEVAARGGASPLATRPERPPREDEEESNPREQ